MSILERLTRLENEATEFGFKWETPQQIQEQILSEVREIDVHLEDQDRNKLQEEIGDLLHAVCSLTVFCGFDPEETLRMSVDKFEKRLQAVKRLTTERGLDSMHGMTFDELMDVWKEAKRQP